MTNLLDKVKPVVPVVLHRCPNGLLVRSSDNTDRFLVMTRCLGVSFNEIDELEWDMNAPQEFGYVGVQKFDHLSAGQCPVEHKTRFVKTQKAFPLAQKATNRERIPLTSSTRIHADNKKQI